MIHGTGIDLVEVRRIEKLIKNHAALGRIFGEDELKYLSRKQTAESYAANFCAKEAFAKALGTGVRGFKLCEVELLRDDLGKPFYKLSGDALKLAQGLIFHISITHTATYAAAFTVAERIDHG